MSARAAGQSKTLLVCMSRLPQMDISISIACLHIPVVKRVDMYSSYPPPEPHV